MDRQIIALFIQEGGKFLTQLIRSRPVHGKTPDTIEAMESKSKEIADRELEIIQTSDLEISAPREGQTESHQPHALERVGSTPTPATTPATTPEKATSIASGCVPCALGHYGTCSGLLNEAVRFSHGEDGMISDEVLDRISMCLEELNSMERVDLRPEMVNQLPSWEKSLADKALEKSRATRHILEGMKTPEDLSQVAGTLQEFQRGLYRSWAKQRIGSMTPEEKAEMTGRILSRLEEQNGE